MHFRVDNFLQYAFDAIENVKIGGKGFITNGNKVPKEYKGYISSLGANIVQSGVKAALTFYEAEEKGTKGDRRLINHAILYILKNSGIITANQEVFRLSDYVSKGDAQKKAFEILDAATALKLALRTYKLN
jgi:CRISPR-associated protein Cmr5